MSFHALNNAWTIGQAIGIIIASAIVHVTIILSWGFMIVLAILSVYKKLAAIYSRARTNAHKSKTSKEYVRKQENQETEGCDRDFNRGGEAYWSTW